jgi:hypothetical protein
MPNSATNITMHTLLLILLLVSIIGFDVFYNYKCLMMLNNPFTISDIIIAASALTHMSTFIPKVLLGFCVKLYTIAKITKITNKSELMSTLNILLTVWIIYCSMFLLGGNFGLIGIYCMYVIIKRTNNEEFIFHANILLKGWMIIWMISVGFIFGLFNVHIIEPTSNGHPPILILNIIVCIFIIMVGTWLGRNHNTLNPKRICILGAILPIIMSMMIVEFYFLSNVFHQK